MAHNADIQSVETDAISIDFALISTFPYVERLSILYNHRAPNAKATWYGLLATKDGVPIK
ncbi:MAG TPA: hypothetical protein DEV81_01100 [Cyanobacteria bacterium UBA11049]|nr:hypothetical protein [Cyanobacteria bacterium UBA11049]